MNSRAEIDILEEKGQDECLRDCFFEDMENPTDSGDCYFH